MVGKDKYIDDEYAKHKRNLYNDTIVQLCKSGFINSVGILAVKISKKEQLNFKECTTKRELYTVSAILDSTSDNWDKQLPKAKQKEFLVLFKDSVGVLEENLLKFTLKHNVTKYELENLERYITNLKKDYNLNDDDIKLETSPEANTTSDCYEIVVTDKNVKGVRVNKSQNPLYSEKHLPKPKFNEINLHSNIGFTKFGLAKQYAIKTLNKCNNSNLIVETDSLKNILNNTETLKDVEAEKIDGNSWEKYGSCVKNKSSCAYIFKKNEVKIHRKKMILDIQSNVNKFNTLFTDIDNNGHIYFVVYSIDYKKLLKIKRTYIPDFKMYHSTHSNKQAAEAPLDPGCWGRMPTGCNKNLSETTVDETKNTTKDTGWFLDKSANSKDTCEAGNRVNAFNTYCGRVDTMKKWRDKSNLEGFLGNKVIEGNTTEDDPFTKAADNYAAARKLAEGANERGRRGIKSRVANIKEDADDFDNWERLQGGAMDIVNEVTTDLNDSISDKKDDYNTAERKTRDNEYNTKKRDAQKLIVLWVCSTIVAICLVLLLKYIVNMILPSIVPDAIFYVLVLAVLFFSSYKVIGLLNDYMSRSKFNFDEYRTDLIDKIEPDDDDNEDDDDN
jgi:hypothetical protein